VPVAQEQIAYLAQGSQTRVHQQVASTSASKRYRTRVASTATQVNLRFEEAKPTLVQGLVKNLSGVL
jgi:Enterobacterial TraT complement resistance protein